MSHDATYKNPGNRTRGALRNGPSITRALTDAVDRLSLAVEALAGAVEAQDKQTRLRCRADMGAYIAAVRADLMRARDIGQHGIGKNEMGDGA